MKTAYVISAVIAIVLTCVVTCSWAECSEADKEILLKCLEKVEKAGADPSCDVLRDLVDCFKPVAADCPTLVGPTYKPLKNALAAQKCGGSAAVTPSGGSAAVRPSFGIVVIAAAMLTIFIFVAKY